MGNIDTLLEKLGMKRRILLRLPHFLVAPLIVTMPRRLAMLFAGFANLALLDSPPPQITKSCKQFTKFTKNQVVYQ